MKEKRLFKPTPAEMLRWNTVEKHLTTSTRELKVFSRPAKQVSYTDKGGRTVCNGRVLQTPFCE